MAALTATLLVAVGLVVVPATPANASLSGLPAGFVDELVVGSLPFPTAIAFAPDGRMFVALKSGIVRLVEDGALRPTPFIDIRTRVHDNHDRGLLGLAVHPDFPVQPYVFLLYTYDPPGTNPDQGSPVAGRTAQLMRVEADAATNYTTAKPGIETILLGQQSSLANIGDPNNGRDTAKASCMTGLTMAGAPIQDCIPSDENSHTIGTVVFGPDDTMYVSNGDGANYGGVDHRALRSLMLDSLAGKVLRIDPMTGHGLADNPFFQPGAPDSNRSKVWSYGLRNPFRMTVHPLTGAAYVGDVGWGQWEEINTGKGANFGWPCYEGGMSGGQPVSLQQGSYRTNASTAVACQALFDQGLGAVTPPAWAYPHPGGASANAGAFYTGTTYPPAYRDALFIADYNRRWIKRLTTDATGAATVTDFGLGTSGPVQVVAGPDTNLYWVMYSSTGGQVRRIRYVGGGNSAPVAIADASPRSGQAPLEVQFIGDRSYDVDGQPLRHSWDFGDGTPASAQANPTHTYTQPGVYDAVLTVTEDVAGGQSYEATVRVNVGSTPPVVSIESPEDGSTYRVGDVISLAGRGTTPTGPLPAEALSWELRHGHNEHFHYETPTATADPNDTTLSRTSFTVTDHGDSTWYEVCLTARAGELTDTQCSRIDPRTTPITVATEPLGMEVSYEDEGLPLFGPAIINPIEGSTQTVSVASIQQHRSFVGWDDGSTATTRTFTVGTQPRTLTATFENRQPSVSVTPSAPSGVAPFTVTLTATGSDPEGDTLTYAWDAGAAGTGSGAAAAFTFATPGTYPVTVTATDALGSSATATATVTVTSAPSTVTFRGAAAGNAYAQSVAVKIPATVRAGDVLLLVAIANRADATLQAPAGWVDRGRRVDQTMQSRVWSRVATVADADASITLRSSAKARLVGQVLAYRGVHTTSPFSQVVSAAEPVFTAQHRTPAATGSPGAWVISIWADKSSGTTSWTLPPGVVQRTYRGTVGTGRVTSVVADSGGPAVGSRVGELAATASTASGRATMWTMVLSPATG
jgi:glucose/arabinose dehydrogenase